MPDCVPYPPDYVPPVLTAECIPQGDQCVWSGEREGGRDGERKGGMEGRMEGKMKGGREGGTEGGRDGGIDDEGRKG